MPNRGDRGGAQTRARIAAIATELFLERGFEDVTIAEVAAAAGVSKVTVFAHFDRKEDLLLDRLPDVRDVVRTAIHERADDVGAVEAIRRAVLALAAQRHPLSGLSEGAEPFLRTLIASPALTSRLRGFEYEIEKELAADLDADSRFRGDSALTAALLVAAYRTVAVEMVRRRLAGDDLAEIAAAHQARLERAFEVLATGLPNGG
ncbi:TetR/AcrR family transcriptional regulator [Streptomyces malaysiensis]|uniref:TetR/AcrR family transcriptional regulator n=1 Tax=Streptomyces malaysiensis subsp. samsunensis TaxID=459658 RepID=A0A9X2LV12_STRMQ|nr:TetR/AcrR family transcriptional regulator [Streptomyces samsunensis]MCQ8830092.1 TetR/AcrR family transcriptional regulator [Streptomyces samsunensis]